MQATHIDFKEPGHLRVEDRKKVLCVGPKADMYQRLYRPGLPSWPLGLRADGRKSQG